VDDTQKRIAGKIRLHLEKRIAEILECPPSELPRMKLGTLVHFAFLLKGHTQEIGGFNTSMSAILDLVGNDLVWDLGPKDETEEPKIVVVN